MAAAGSTGLRHLVCALGDLNNAKGSARYSHGDSSVLVTVTNPIQAREREARLERAIVKAHVLGFSTGSRRNVGATGVNALHRRQEEMMDVAQMCVFIERCLSEVIMLEHFPRMQVQFTAQVLKADGGLLSVLINAAMLAVLDAGLPCRGVLGAVSACTTGSLAGTPVLKLDPSQSVIDEADSVGLFVHWPGRGLIASKTAGSTMSADLFWMYQSATASAAERLVGTFRTFVKEGKFMGGLPVDPALAAAAAGDSKIAMEEDGGEEE
eukprot:Hpha_TRINITY_DN26027_c0_g1::TRINITY_DN26027_c0_g1_i1::g.115233::m.115233/K11600/RRP41, EXOSC4, SKI6; exosome complex component RRP41